MVTLNDVREPGGLGKLEAIAVSDLEPGLQRGRSGCHKRGQLSEEALEPAGTDDLDHAGWHLAGVPHRMHLLAGLGDVSARAEDDLSITRAETDLTLRDNGVLVLPVVDVWGDQCADG